MEVKKDPKKDLQRSRPQFMAMGMVISLSLAITAFEWRTEQKGIDMFDESGQIWDTEQVFITKMPPPEPPKPKIVAPIVIATKEEVEKPPVEIDFMDPFEDDLTDDIVIYEPEEEKVEEIHDIVEQMPSPIGGMENFYKFLGKKMKYPKQARRMGIEGKVYLRFVIDTDGRMTDMEVVRGIGAGCDEEALRVMGLAPSWNPGKQRGMPVKVRMIVPIFFKLN